MTPEELFERNMRLVYHYIHRTNFSIPGYDLEDVIQVGMIGLWKAALTFRQDMGYRFSTYAVACIKNELLRERKVLAPKMQQTLPIDEVETASVPGVEDEALASASVSMAEIPKEVRAILHLSQYISKADIARLLGRSKASVSALHRRARLTLGGL